MLVKYKKYLLFAVVMFITGLILRIDASLPSYISEANVIRAVGIAVIGALLMFGWDTYKARKS
jgi:cytochrome b subunit of formate dehydrogenase